ncbi:4181_t:CDS:2 [Paraglomus brasilianum]|uniref:4181_t:CDS:1 n=1 Tax=Paraglomus brasilianum TaxID=144538 RepID=A0A9N9GGC9_9GLOM|nr:4181_t:CDS:2 [Paraglomus brasilianum]
MSTPTIIAAENLAEKIESWGLHHSNIQFIEETPGCTRNEAHRNLGIGLGILLKNLPKSSRHYSQATVLKKALEVGPENNLRKVTGSMVEKVKRSPLTVDDIDLEETFIDYCNKCKNIFDLCHSDIMDMRPTSRFTDEIAEESWNKFVLEEWKNFIQEFFEPKDSQEKWTKAWRGLHNGKEIDENKKTLVDAIHNILRPYIKAFEAPYVQHTKVR